VYKFGGQPYFNELINRHFRTSFNNTFGERKGKLMMQACAGSLTGIGEVVLLPLDVLKIKRQVNPEAFRGRGVFRIFAEEGFNLYRGWGWTMARNAPGSFAVSPSCLVNTGRFLMHGMFNSALRRVRGYEGLLLGCYRLFEGDLDAKLHCIHLWSSGIYYCRRSA
jgi:hypothetical protein